MKPRVQIILSIILLIILLMPGCTGDTNTTTTGPTEGYKIYVMKSYDNSLAWCNHPLFSFEYPNSFEFYTLSDTLYDRSRVDFMCQRSELPYRNLSVVIYEPWHGHYDNANEYMEYLITEQNVFGDNYTVKQIKISGINTDYIEFIGKPNYLGKQYIYKLVTFDHTGLIWTIYLETFSSYPEPLEVQESFNHILETFNIINNCDNTRPDSILRINVTYEDGVFAITNEEDSRLCETKLYLNYSDNDLSTGYQAWGNTGMDSKDTVQIQLLVFKNLYGASYQGYPKPFILLVQAEFPGCEKVYSYTKTWE